MIVEEKKPTLTTSVSADTPPKSSLRYSPEQPPKELKEKPKRSFMELEI